MKTLRGSNFVNCKILPILVVLVVIEASALDAVFGEATRPVPTDA